MRLDPAVLDGLRIDFTLRRYIRATPLSHAATPLGLGFGETRFASPTDAFKVLYVARSLVTGVAETIIRDRFVGRTRRRLAQAEVESWGVTEVRTVAPLSLLDLRTTGVIQLGVPTDVVRGKSHRLGRRFSEALYVRAPAVDGILYQSRLTSDVCVAVYDRAVGKLASGPVEPIVREPGLIPALAGLNVTVIAS